MAKILITKKLVKGKPKLIQYYCQDVTKDFHCNEGLIKKADLKKKQAKTNTGKVFNIFDAQFSDDFSRIKRGPQTMPAKDLGIIITTTGMNKTSKIVDSGTGSGAAAIQFASIAKEVHTYDILKQHLDIAQENIKKLNIKNCKTKIHDITKSIPQKNVDIINLDMPEPWLVVKHAIKALKSGGWLVSYSPHMPQVMDFCKEVDNNKELMTIKTIEITEREWEVNNRKVRPKTQSIGHSGFLTFVRKIA